MESLAGRPPRARAGPLAPALGLLRGILGPGQGARLGAAPPGFPRESRRGTQEFVRHEGWPVRFVIVGAGAIGAYIGARMAQAGLDVTLFARGPHLRAMQERGVRVTSPQGDFD